MEQREGIMLSERQNLTPVADLIEEIHPNSILDVGVGFGNYGMIARSFSDIWFDRHFKKDWKVIIDGIEYHKEMVNPVYDFVYDNVFIGDALDILPKLAPYDLIICLHIIEHMTRPEGLKLLDLLDQKFNKRIILGTPSRMFQTEVQGLDKERHLSLWSVKDFTDRGYSVQILGCGDILAVKNK